MTSPRCIVCGSSMRPRVRSWSSRCVTCRTWRSTLEPAIGGDTDDAFDEDVREPAIEELRRRNFEQALDRIEAHRPIRGQSVLDVGSAHGWFLEAVRARGAEPHGIEPDEAVAARAADQTISVRRGYFPDVLAAEEQFDLIAFNDVLEHIPDVGATLDACRAHLRDDGILSINIPTSDGLAYKVVSAMSRVGVKHPYERLWQYGLQSPHTSYFPRQALAGLVTQHGFDVVEVGPLRAVVRDGLWERVHVYRKPTPASVAGFAALVALSPVLNAARFCDIVHIVARKRA